MESLDCSSRGCSWIHIFAQKIYLMGLNRSPLVNVFSTKVMASVAGRACARAARAQAGACESSPFSYTCANCLRAERGWELISKVF